MIPRQLIDVKSEQPYIQYAYSKTWDIIMIYRRYRGGVRTNSQKRSRAATIPGPVAWDGDVLNVLRGLYRPLLHQVDEHAVNLHVLLDHLTGYSTDAAQQ